MRTSQWLLLLGFGILATRASFANPEISAQRSVNRSASGDYLNTVIRLSMRYENQKLLEGTKVYFHYGYQTIHRDTKTLTNWQGISTSKATPSAEKRGVFELVEEAIISSVYEENEAHRLQFVIRLLYPSGHEGWVKGSDSAFGYFETSSFYEESCPIGTECPLTIDVIEQDQAFFGRNLPRERSL